jgi:hypothetical protein
MDQPPLLTTDLIVVMHHGPQTRSVQQDPLARRSPEASTSILVVNIAQISHHRRSADSDRPSLGNQGFALRLLHREPQQEPADWARLATMDGVDRRAYSP